MDTKEMLKMIDLYDDKINSEFNYMKQKVVILGETANEMARKTSLLSSACFLIVLLIGVLLIVLGVYAVGGVIALVGLVLVIVVYFNKNGLAEIIRTKSQELNEIIETKL